MSDAVDRVLGTITSLEELEGFQSALLRADLKTKAVTEEQMQRIAMMKIDMQRRNAK